MKSTADKKSIGLGQRLRWRLRRRSMWVPVWVPVWAWVFVAALLMAVRLEIEPKFDGPASPGALVFFHDGGSGDRVLTFADPLAVSIIEKRSSMTGGDGTLNLLPFIVDVTWRHWPSDQWALIEHSKIVATYQGQPTNAEYFADRALADRFEAACDSYLQREGYAHLLGAPRTRPVPGEPAYLYEVWSAEMTHVLWDRVFVVIAKPLRGLALIVVGLGVVIPSRAERRKSRWLRGECPSCRYPRPPAAGRCPECGAGWAEEEVPLQAVGPRR